MGHRKRRRAKTARANPRLPQPVAGDDTHRLLIIRYAVLFGLLASLAIAPRLWLNSEHFGPISVFGVPWPLPFSLDLFSYWLIVGLLVPAFWSRNVQGWLRLWLVVAFLRCFWDRILWQPYLLQYGFMVLVLGWSGAVRNRDSLSNDSTTQGENLHAGQLGTLRLVVCAVYFWSGFAKLHHGFLKNGARWIFGGALPDEAVAALAPWAWVMPVAEMILPLGLMTDRLRRVSVLGLIGMHAGILWVIGPLGKNVNQIVWPWNVVMIVCLATLFWRAPSGARLGWLRRRTPPTHKLAILLFLVGPALSYAGLWPVYLSFRMYSVREPRAYLEMPTTIADRLPTETQQLLRTPRDNPSMRRLPILDWSDRELNAIVPTEVAVYRQVAKKFCRAHDGEGPIVLAIREEPNTWTGEASWRRLACNEL